MMNASVGSDDGTSAEELGPAMMDEGSEDVREFDPIVNGMNADPED